MKARGWTIIVAVLLGGLFPALGTLESAGPERRVGPDPREWDRIVDKAIQYLQVKDGTTNVWEVPFSGGNPKQLTHFTSGEVYDYGWSPDGKDLFLARGEFGGDPVLLTQIQ